MRVMLVGGGSGGHITPNLAVAHQLKTLEPTTQVLYVGQTGEVLADLAASDAAIDKTYSVRAGKLRRYHGDGWRQLLDWRTMALNIRDVAYVAAGLVQSWLLLRRVKPDVVFIKGGFVGVPVGLAAAARRIPYITHDSDALPGLANRLISRWAALHTVALPKEVYTYPPAKTVTVGVPVSHHYRMYTQAEKLQLAKELGVVGKRVLLVTGGGLGAQRLNRAVVAAARPLLAAYPDLYVHHLAGRALADETTALYNAALPATDRERVTVEGFSKTLYKWAAIAEVAVARAGGNSIAEFAALASACVIVPNPELTGGHQTLNGKALADRQAVVLVEEAEIKQNPSILAQSIEQLLQSPDKARTMGGRLQAVAVPDAAQRLAVLLLKQSRKNNA